MSRSLLALLALVTVALSGCYTNPAPPLKRPILEGLVATDFKLTPAGTSLDSFPSKIPLVIVSGANMDATLQYGRDFNAAIKQTRPSLDLAGLNAEGRASEDPRNSVSMLTAALRSCFGETKTARDLQEAVKEGAQLVAVIDVTVDYPFWGNWKVWHDALFLDRQGRLVEQINAGASLLPLGNKDGLVVQQRAAETFLKELRRKRADKCAN